MEMTTTTTIASYLVLLAVLPALVQCYQPSTRREIFGTVAAAMVTTLQPASANAVVSAKMCYQGEGEGCADMAGDNALIKSLQEKSAANREKNEKVRG